jgi:Domain of unknown function (DUF1735)
MKFYKPVIFSLLLLSFFMTGCLKDKDYDNGSIQSVRSGDAQKLVEIALTATSIDNFLVISMNSSNTDTTIGLIPVIVNSADGATEDVNVTLVPNPALIGDYNANNGTLHEQAPASVFTIVNPPSSDGTGYIVTITKGTNTGFLQVKLKTSDYLGHDYAFGYQISKVDKSGYLVSSNLSTGVVAIGVKNKYDGNYTLKIETIGWTAYGIADGVTAIYPGNLGLVTASANAVTTTNPSAGPLEPAFTGTAGVPGTIGGPTAFGATTPEFVFDLATDKITNILNTTPDDGRGRVLIPNPAVTDNRYDAATKTIYAAYIMKQNGRPNQFIYDTLKYVGPR